jgi:hypothetical protein
MTEKRLTEGELDHLIRIFEVLAQQARGIKVHHEGSVDIRCLSALEELRERRAHQPAPSQDAERLARWHERGAYCLAEMMKAYERRIRSDCNGPEDLAKRPWECAEYVEGAKFLRTTSQTAVRHERRVVGHVSGWQEQMDTCVCGLKWPCPTLQQGEKHET